MKGTRLRVAWALLALGSALMLGGCDLLFGLIKNQSTKLVVVNGSPYPMDTLYVAPAGTGYSTGFSASSNLLTSNLNSGASITLTGYGAGQYDIEGKIAVPVPSFGGEPYYATSLSGSYPSSPETVMPNMTNTIDLNVPAPW